MGGEFNSEMNDDSSEVPNGRIKQESLGIGDRNFLRRKLESAQSKNVDSDSDEDDRGLDVGSLTPGLRLPKQQYEDPDDLDDPFDEDKL